MTKTTPKVTAHKVDGGLHCLISEDDLANALLDDRNQLQNRREGSAFDLADVSSYAADRFLRNRR